MFSNVESYRRCSAVFQRITVASRLCSSASRQSHGDLMAWAVPMPCAWRTALCSVSSAQQVEQLDVQSQPRRHFRLNSFFFNSLFLTKIAIIASDYFKIICDSQIFLSICESSCVSFVYGIGCSDDSLPLTPSNKQCTAWQCLHMMAESFKFATKWHGPTIREPAERLCHEILIHGNRGLCVDVLIPNCEVLVGCI